jgi:general secretion pathway protein H
MPTSDRGSDRRGRRVVPARRGFTLIELLVVLAIVAIASGLVTVALRDGAQSRLDEEGARLASLLEAARAEARAAGVPVRWETAQPGTADPQGADFRFVGLSADLALPTHWLRAGTQAEVVGARAVILGPEPILPPQRIVLRLEDRSLMLSSDGLAPFAPAATP